jgi:hypothetical protein
MRNSKWFKEGEQEFQSGQGSAVNNPYGARSAKALIWEEGFKSAVAEFHKIGEQIPDRSEQPQ